MIQMLQTFTKHLSAYSWQDWNTSVPQTVIILLLNSPVDSLEWIYLPIPGHGNRTRMNIKLKTCWTCCKLLNVVSKVLVGTLCALTWEYNLSSLTWNSLSFKLVLVYELLVYVKRKENRERCIHIFIAFSSPECYVTYRRGIMCYHTTLYNFPHSGEIFVFDIYWELKELWQVLIRIFSTRGIPLMTEISRGGRRWKCEQILRECHVRWYLGDWFCWESCLWLHLNAHGSHNSEACKQYKMLQGLAIVHDTSQPVAGLVC